MASFCIMDHDLDYHVCNQYYCQICAGSLEYSGRYFLTIFCQKMVSLSKSLCSSILPCLFFLTSPIGIRCATNILMSLAFKLGHLLIVNVLSMDYLHGRITYTVIGLHIIFCFFFNFHLFNAIFHSMEHPNGPLVMSKNFYVQMQGLEQQQMVVSFLSTKTTCKYIYTLNLLLFLYIYIYR